MLLPTVRCHSLSWDIQKLATQYVTQDAVPTFDLPSRHLHNQPPSAFHTEPLNPSPQPDHLLALALDVSVNGCFSSSLP